MPGGFACIIELAVDGAKKQPTRWSSTCNERVSACGSGVFAASLQGKQSSVPQRDVPSYPETAGQIAVAYRDLCCLLPNSTQSGLLKARQGALLHRHAASYQEIAGRIVVADRDPGFPLPNSTPSGLPEERQDVLRHLYAVCYPEIGRRNAEVLRHH